MITNTQFISPELASRRDLDVRAGDTVRVHVKIEEKGKTRIQLFEGLVLARKHGSESGGTITVRKVSHGVGVERIFPIYSPMIEKIEVIRRSRVRRSKLYFIREKVTRDIRRKMRNFIDYFSSSSDLIAKEEPMMEEVVEEATGEVAPESVAEVVAEEVATPETEASTEEAPVEEPKAE